MVLISDVLATVVGLTIVVVDVGCVVVVLLGVDVDFGVNGTYGVKIE